MHDAGRGRVADRPHGPRTPRDRMSTGRGRSAPAPGFAALLHGPRGRVLPHGPCRGGRPPEGGVVRPRLSVSGRQDASPAEPGSGPDLTIQGCDPAGVPLTATTTPEGATAADATMPTETRSYGGGSGFFSRDVATHVSSGISSYTDPARAASSFAFCASTSSAIFSLRNIQ